MFKINWESLAEITFEDEIDFIFQKWNQSEVDKFALLVSENLERLSKNATLGIYKSKYNCHSLVLSKQTTLYYKIIEDKSQIDLILFWNNQKKPADLMKLL